MATQWITIAKIGGSAADVIAARLQEWFFARRAADPNLWSPDQWPSAVRKRADAFADSLLAHGHMPPVVHMIQWVDMWLMGDVFPRWLTPPDGERPRVVYAGKYEMYGYNLPDAGRLAKHLASAGPQQYTESDWLVGRLREAVSAWEGMVDRSVLVVLRRVVSGSAYDEKLRASLSGVPDWLS